VNPSTLNIKMVVNGDNSEDMKVTQVVADQLRNVVGSEVAAAEAKVRAHVDSLVEEKSAPVKAKISALRAEADKRFTGARAKLDAEKQKLDTQLKALSGGLVGLP
jgi:predicted thioredoxin/glutaredoxin